MKLILRTENRIEDHEQQIGHQKITLYENQGNSINLRGGGVESSIGIGFSFGLIYWFYRGGFV